MCDNDNVKAYMHAYEYNVLKINKIKGKIREWYK